VSVVLMKKRVIERNVVVVKKNSLLNTIWWSAENVKRNFVVMAVLPLLNLMTEQ
jgi:hypothetical protein